MSATNVPVRQVLAEWARVGGTRVVGAERITAGPVTLQLEAVPEAKALDIVLRGAAGYVAAARPVAGGGRSMYDRILVLATSTPPATPAGAAAGAAANRPASANRFGMPPGAEPPDAPEAEVEAAQVADTPQVNPFVNAFGQPGMPAQFGQPGQPGQPGVPTQFGQPGQPNPFGQVVAPAPFGQPFQQAPAGGVFPAQPQTGAPPQGFFGVVGSATPGMVMQPVPQPPQPAATPLPGVRPRPQG
jgi:hypothetical protein